MYRFFVLLICLLSVHFVAHGTESNSINYVTPQKADSLIYPEVGKPCPDFELHNIQFFSKRKASLKDFRGKWLLLDFWNRSCGACIASFPHVSEMQKEFGGQLQVMMVAIQDPQRQVNLMYERYRAKEKLVMPCAFDSLLAKKFDILICPHSMLIDDKGIVRCITSSIHTSEMKEFLVGKTPVLPKKYRLHEDPPIENNPVKDNIIPFNYNLPFAVGGNGAVDSVFLFRSILTKWIPGINRQLDFGSIEGGLASSQKKAFSALGTGLKSLYFYSYFGTSYLDPYSENYGKYCPYLAIEVKDSSVFSPDYKTGKNVFCYSVNLPTEQATVERVKGIMQRDLENYFGFVLSVETRKCPCLVLKATIGTNEKLKTKGKATNDESVYPLSFKLTNVPFADITQLIQTLTGRVVYDESGITGNVDLNVDCKDCVMTDPNDLKKALKLNGLELIPSEKEMKVLVIRDNK